MSENGEIFTAGKNFTLQSEVTEGTNLSSGARFPTKANATYPHTSSFSSWGRGSPTQILKTFLILDKRVNWVNCLLALKVSI